MYYEKISNKTKQEQKKKKKKINNNNNNNNNKVIRCHITSNKCILKNTLYILSIGKPELTV